MRVYKEKQYLIFDFEDGRMCKYDFATKISIGIRGKEVKDLRGQLQGFSMSELFDCCEDQKYAKFLKFVQDCESEQYGIYSIGTILDRIPHYARYEQIFAAGVDELIGSYDLPYYANRNRPLEYFYYSLKDIPKSLIKLAQTHSFKLTNEIVGGYKEDPNAFVIAFNLEYITLDMNDILTIWQFGWQKYHESTSYFSRLVARFGYKPKDLWLYLDRIKTYEAIEEMKFLIKELYDYANMMQGISNKFDKYPRNFLTTHKIACRNYNRMMKEFSEELFRKRRNEKYECTFGDYTFIYPKTTQDIKDEAATQNNCVASYIDRVIDGQCHILFLRKKDRPQDSLVTIEVRNNKIVQARQRFNDPVSDEQQEVIDAFNKKFSKDKKEKAA